MFFSHTTVSSPSPAGSLVQPAPSSLHSLLPRILTENKTCVLLFSACLNFGFYTTVQACPTKLFFHKPMLPFNPLLIVFFLSGVKIPFRSFPGELHRHQMHSSRLLPAWLLTDMFAVLLAHSNASESVSLLKILTPGFVVNCASGFWDQDSLVPPVGAQQALFCSPCVCLHLLCCSHFSLLLLLLDILSLTHGLTRSSSMKIREAVI